MKLNKRGQIVVEYVLLLTIAVTISALLVKQLVGREDEEPGILVRQWHVLMRSVAEDIPDQRQ